MNESLDLRNRILKMRESNNLVLEKVKSESQNIVSNSELINQKIKHSSNKEKENLKDTIDKTNIEIQKENRRNSKENEQIVDSNLFTKRPPNSNIRYEKKKETIYNLADYNEAQFRIIANKFNEAVEVILELSEKVKKLEEVVNNLPLNYVKYNKKESIFNIKTYAYIFVITLFIIGIFTIPIDLSLFKLIIKDIITSI